MAYLRFGLDRIRTDSATVGYQLSYSQLFYQYLSRPGRAHGYVLAIRRIHGVFFGTA